MFSIGLLLICDMAVNNYGDQYNFLFVLVATLKKPFFLNFYSFIYFKWLSFENLSTVKCDGKVL